MGEIKYNVFKYLGYIPVFFFIVQYYCRRDHCGPFRNIEKAFALIYQLIFGLSGAKMNDLLEISTWNSIAFDLWTKHFDDLNEWVNYCLENMFSTQQ